MCWFRRAPITLLSIASREIYAREGVDLDRSTLAGWVGGTSELLAPLVEAIRTHVMSAIKLHADDTPVPVLAPGNGKTKTGGLWTYVRDDRPSGDTAPPPCGSLTYPIARAKTRSNTSSFIAARRFRPTRTLASRASYVYPHNPVWIHNSDPHS
jgi:hypothetical protein